jgi:hypothetical protein
MVVGAVGRQHVLSRQLPRHHRTHRGDAEGLGLLQGIMSDGAAQRHGFVYVLCLDPPRGIADADIPDLPGLIPKRCAPISHYVGYTKQDWPMRRAGGYGGAGMITCVLLTPGTQDDEEKLKRHGKCPPCHKSLNYRAKARRSARLLAAAGHHHGLTGGHPWTPSKLATLSARSTGATWTPTPTATWTPARSVRPLPLRPCKCPPFGSAAYMALLGVLNGRPVDLGGPLCRRPDCPVTERCGTHARHRCQWHWFSCLRIW